jgi:hypothetical protein
VFIRSARRASEADRKSESGSKKSTRSHQKKGTTTLDVESVEGEDGVSAEAPTASKGGMGGGGQRKAKAMTMPTCGGDVS